MPTTIFLSSTFLDLEEHRRLVLGEITTLEHRACAMEVFGALPESPKEECLRLVRTADIYVGVFGVRYGTLDAETGKSMTHLEYEEALAVKVPCLIYLIDEDRHLVLPSHVERGNSASKLADLKLRLQKNHVVRFFSSSQDLASKLTLDIMRLIGASEITPTANVLAQIAKNATVRYPLTEPRFFFLRDKVKGVFKELPPDAVLREALELILAGDNFAASFVLNRGAQLTLDEAVDALMSIEEILANILQRGRRAISERSAAESPQQE